MNVPASAVRAAPSRTARAIARSRSLLGPTPWLFLAAAVAGAAAGGGAVLLHKAIEALQQGFFGDANPVTVVLAGGTLGHVRALLAPLVGGALVGLIVRWTMRDCEPGVPGVLRAIQERGGRLSVRDAMGAAAASAVSLGSGLSLGREGPAVHLGASIASGVGRSLVTSSRELRVLVACGAGAGLAAMFDAPLGGAAFALEVVVGSFALEACGPVLLATVAGTTVARGLQQAPVVSMPAHSLGHPVELLAYLALGLLAGLVAAALIRGVGLAVKHGDALPVPRWIKPALGGLVVGAVAVLGSPRVLGNGYETVTLLLNGHALEASLLLLLALKIITTSVSVGSGGVGGLFGPSVFLGAVLGALVGQAVQLISPAAQPGAFALVGMAAVVAGTNHAPLCMVLMVSETTGDYALVLPLLVGTAVASTLARRLCPESIDHVVAATRGTRLRKDSALDAVHVSDVVRAAPEAVVSPATPLAEVLNTFLRARSDLVVVVGPGGVEGGVLLEDVHSAVAGTGAARRLVIADDVMRDDLPRLSPDDTLAAALEAFNDVRCGTLPVVDAGGALVGLIDDRQLVAALRAERMRADLAGVGGADGGLDLGPDSVLARVTAPTWLAGRTLADVDLRRRTGVQVVALRAQSGRSARLPDPRAPITAGTTLVVVGPVDAVEALREGTPPATEPPRLGPSAPPDPPSAPT